MNEISSSISAFGEFALISRITAPVKNNSTVITGIGDDAAVTALTPGMQLLTSTDMLLEDVHFRLSWHDPFLLGRKSLAVSISDIAAMGGIPRWALLSLAIPSDTSLKFIDEFMRGFHSMAKENGVVLIGGDTCTSKYGLTISVTIMGEQYPDKILRRFGAMPDDDIWVTGTLGDAALALKFIEAGTPECFPASKLLNPTPRIAEALAISETSFITSMIDISDGVLADFAHIAEQSNVGGKIFIEQIPLSDEFKKMSVIPYELALSGGEDYELCFTANPSNREKIVSCIKKSGIQLTRIGIVTPALGVVAFNPDGTKYLTGNDGFNHFKCSNNLK